MHNPAKRKKGQMLCVSAGLALVIVLTVWCFKLSAAPQNVNWFVWGVLCIPMLLALPGLLRGKLYTYRWASMLCLMYFTHGVMEAWSEPNERIPALAEVWLSIQLFIGSIWFVQGEIGKRPKRKKA